jgi:hypothetical protein
MGSGDKVHFLLPLLIPYSPLPSFPSCRATVAVTKCKSSEKRFMTTVGRNELNTSGSYKFTDGRKNMKVKKTALIICNDGKEYWITQKQFWNMVREGVVVQTGNFPLTGRFRGRDDQLLITIQHTVLNKATPIHTGEVLRILRLRKNKG